MKKNEINVSHLKKSVTSHDIGYLIKNKGFLSVYPYFVFVKLVIAYSLVNQTSKSKISITI